MNYYGAKNMADSWRTVRGNTVQVAQDIPADKYDFRPADDTMTVGETLAHMATMPDVMMNINLVDKLSDVGIPDFGKYMGQANAVAATLTTKEAIVEALKGRGEAFAKGLEGVNDSQLAEVVVLPGGQKTRFEMLLGAKEHEMHHRAQLMTMQRLMGIVPHLTRARRERSAAAARATAS